MREIGGDNRAKLHCIIISISNSSRVVLRIEVSGGDVFFIIQIVLMCAFVLILGFVFCSYVERDKSQKTATLFLVLLSCRLLFWGAKSIIAQSTIILTNVAFPTAFFKKKSLE